MAYHHGNLREALLESAADHVRNNGWESLSLRRAAEGAGVSHAAPYHHFKDKESLLAAVATFAFERLNQRLDAAGPTLSDLGRAYVKFAWDEPHLYQLMFGGPMKEPEEHADLHTASCGAFERLMARIAPLVGGEADRHFAAAMDIWAMVHGFASLTMNGRLDGLAQKFSVELPDLDRMLDVFLARVDRAVPGGV